MRHLKYVVLALLSVVICFGLWSTDNDVAGIPEDIQHYAEGAGLEEFKKLILEDPAGYGYKNEEEVNSVTLGPGFEVHYFDAGKFDRVTDSLMDLSKPTGQYEFIVYSGGAAKSFLSIERHNAGFRVVMAGGDASRLDKSLDIMKGSLSVNHETTSPALIKDGNVRFLVSHINGKEVNVPDVPAEKSAILGGMNNNQVWDSEKTIKFLKKARAQVR